METTINVLNTNDEFSNQTNQIDQLINRTIAINNTDGAFQSLFLVSLKIHGILMQYESKQNALIDLISNSHVNMAKSVTTDQSAGNN